jgi:hypothetical protein
MEYFLAQQHKCFDTQPEAKNRDTHRTFRLGHANAHLYIHGTPTEGRGRDRMVDEDAPAANAVTKMVGLFDFGIPSPWYVVGGEHESFWLFVGSIVSAFEGSLDYCEIVICLCEVEGICEIRARMSTSFYGTIGSRQTAHLGGKFKFSSVFMHIGVHVLRSAWMYNRAREDQVYTKM